MGAGLRLRAKRNLTDGDAYMDRCGDLPCAGTLAGCGRRTKRLHFLYGHYHRSSGRSLLHRNPDNRLNGSVNQLRFKRIGRFRKLHLLMERRGNRIRFSGNGCKVLLFRGHEDYHAYRDR